jgi:hypothetical protein
MGGEAATRDAIAASIAAWRGGEDPDLSRLLAALWSELYEKLPALTASRAKEEQHRILEDHLVALGLPRCADLQYVAGPVLWFAREKGVLPPAGGPPGPWTLDPRRHEAARAALAEGVTAYGDWMRDALRSILSEQQ